ncbi:hypothetical protein [Pseudoalteromonas denitrificans]|nr:hypothetical protein [Pseudoalteromonas denitrificans]
MLQTFDHEQLKIFINALKSAIENGENEKAIKAQETLDNYIHLTCGNKEYPQSKKTLQEAKYLIDNLSIYATEKKLNIGKEIIQKKQNAKAIAKYRSV